MTQLSPSLSTTDCLDESLSAADLKAKLVSELEAMFDHRLIEHEGDRLFLSMLAFQFNVVFAHTESKTNVLSRLEEGKASEEVLLYWARIPSWSREETASLICGLDPDAVRDIVVSPAVAQLSRTALEFCRIKTILERTGQRQFEPLDVVRWADRFDIVMPDALRGAIVRMWTDSPSGGPQEEQPISTRARNNLLRIIAGLAKEAGIDVEEGGSGAVQIEAAVALAKFDGPKEKVIRNVLAEIRNLT